MITETITPVFGWLEGCMPSTFKCPHCTDLGFLTQEEGGTTLGTCPHCPLGRAEHRELEASRLDVCCVCGRPGSANGCATCAAAYEYEAEAECH